MSFRVATLILLLLTSSLTPAYEIVPKPFPDWVTRLDVTLDKNYPKSNISGGVHYILVDRQIRHHSHGDKQHFSRFVSLAVNEHGVGSESQINIDFDPEYQQVDIHEIAIIRDGQRLDRIPLSRTSLLQREMELENNIYSGRKTLNIILNDLRPGDFLDYSYSVTGSNPFYDGLFSATYPLQWSVPVEHNHIRVVTDTALNHRTVHTDADVVVKETAQGREYLLHQRDLKAQQIEDNTPAWYTPMARVFFSDHHAWPEVEEWGTQTFSTAIQSGGPVAEVADQLMQEHDDDAERIVAALGYVQREIRYLGLEIAENAHKPYEAAAVMQRRYGDCKDKSVVLVSLLRAMGMDAWPALVNTRLHRGIREYLPGVNAFDHAIVLAEHRGQRYWLDGTRNFQIGPLDNLGQPDYGLALVLGNDVAGLEPMDPRQPARLSATDQFLVPLPGEGATTFTSDSLYEGEMAEHQRGDIAGSGLAGIRASFIDFFRRYYPNIREETPVIFEDDAGNNLVRAHEVYQIDDFWEKDDESGEYVAWFYANLVDTYLEPPDQVSRNDPFGLEHPVSVNQEIVISLPDVPWHFENEDMEEDNTWFNFKYRARFHPDERQLVLTFAYDSKQDHVMPANYPAYREALERAYEHSSYGIFTPDPAAQPAAGSSPGPATWLQATIFLGMPLGLTLAAFGLWRLDLRRHPPEVKAHFHPVSPLKLIVLGSATFGIYMLYWLYRNWRYVSEHEPGPMMPFWRALFAGFWYYPFYQRLLGDSESRFGERRVFPPIIGGLAATVFLAAWLLASAPVYSYFFTVLQLLLLLPLTSYINHINTPGALKYNSRIGLRHILIVIGLLPLTLLTLGTEVGLLPHTRVVSEAELWDRDIRFMERNGIIRPDDEVRFFYSDALWSARDDGNGMTGRHVFSYWRDAGESLNIETATFGEIADFEVTWGGPTATTVIRIERTDGTDFLIYASAEQRGDHALVNALREAVATSQPEIRNDIGADSRQPLP